MRIVIDIDGTIAELKKQSQSYDKLRLNTGAAKTINELKKAGHYIILQTARHMKTSSHNQGVAMAKIGKVTLDWLNKNKIKYDEIYFGKPYADAYIDDLAYPFSSWSAINDKIFDDSYVNVVIPLAGRGTRFVSQGVYVPKPLIEIKGKKMIEWAVKSFSFLPKDLNYSLIFIILKEHIKKFNLDEKLIRMFGKKVIIISLNDYTRGQVETALAAKLYINNYNKLFIYNCDTYSESEIWQVIKNEDPDGVIPYFVSQDSRYSYVKNDKYGYVEKVAEKKVISNFATTGMYYFKRGMDFVNSAEKNIKNSKLESKEFYVGPCYNNLLDSGKRIKAIKSTKHWVFGTPDELEDFNNNFKK